MLDKLIQCSDFRESAEKFIGTIQGLAFQDGACFGVRESVRALREAVSKIGTETIPTPQIFGLLDQLRVQYGEPQESQVEAGEGIQTEERQTLRDIPEEIQKPLEKLHEDAEEVRASQKPEAPILAFPLSPESEEVRHARGIQETLCTPGVRPPPRIEATPEGFREARAEAYRRGIPHKLGLSYGQVKAWFIAQACSEATVPILDEKGNQTGLREPTPLEAKTRFYQIWSEATAQGTIPEV